MTETSRRFKRLVVDTTPFLKGTVSTESAEQLYTTAQVLDEIKDVATKERLAATILPSVTVREPTAAAVQICVEAAKKSGDLASLSRTDLTLVALAVTLDMESNPERVFDVHEPIVMTGSVVSVEQSTANTGESEAKPKHNMDEPDWITADNMAEQLKAMKPPTPTVQHQVDLGCTSGDCAVQNLLLTLKLRAYDADLKRVKQSKSFLLRCHACGWTTAMTADKFCDGCGSPCLLRCTYTVGQDGRKRLWLKPAMTYNLRGTVYSIPKPQGGRHADPLVLRKDQQEYKRALTRARHADEKMAKAVSLSGGMEDVDDRLAAIFGDMQVKGGNGKRSQQAGKAVVGHGRRNPNEVRKH